MPWYATIAVCGFFVCVAAAIVPFPPFRRRWQALASAVCSFITLAALAPTPRPSAVGNVETSTPQVAALINTPTVTKLQTGSTSACIPAEKVRVSQKYSIGHSLTQTEVELMRDCYGLRVDAKASAGRPSSSRVADATIEVPTDLRAQYFLIQTGLLPNGNVVVTSRREGPSGVSYARRECACRTDRFRYLGEGDTLEKTMRSKSPPEKMADLFKTGDGLGSISYHVCQYACVKARESGQRKRAG